MEIKINKDLSYLGLAKWVKPETVAIETIGMVHSIITSQRDLDLWLEEHKEFEDGVLEWDSYYKYFKVIEPKFIEKIEAQKKQRQK